MVLLLKLLQNMTIEKKINKMVDFKLQPIVKIDNMYWVKELPLSDKVCKKSLQASFPIIMNKLDQGHYIKKSKNSLIEVSIVLTDNKEICYLNNHFLGKNKPTNVLAFPLDMINIPIDSEILVGDIVLAWETVYEEANIQAKTVSNHLSHLVIHGFLHLLGYDHQNNDEAIKMENLEIECLSSLGIPSPYISCN